MEKRAVLTFLICGAIFVLWFLLIEPRLLPKKPTKPAENQQGETQSGAGETKGEPKKEGPKIEEPKTEPQKKSEFPLLVEEKSVGFYDIKFTSLGGGIQTLSLRFPSEDSRVLLLDVLEPDRPQFALRVPGLAGNLDLASENWDRVPDPDPRKVVYSYPMPNGVTVRKTFVIREKEHIIEFKLDFRLQSAQPASFAFQLLPFSGILPDSDYTPEKYGEAIVGIRSGDDWSRESTPVHKILMKEWQYVDKNKDWAGIKNRYFAAVLIPDTDQERNNIWAYRFRTLSKEADPLGKRVHNLDLFVENQFINLSNDTPWQPFAYKAYIGPIRADTLKEAKCGLSEILSYSSWFNFVGVVILNLLNFFFGIFKNYGVAIIITTLCIRICIFPLSRKSQMSMFKMSQLQPKLQILRERYKDDQQKMGLEQMRLFRENKVSPLSGCLPMLLQLPVFIAMFSVLDISIDLRRSAFFGWVHDLSQPDVVLGPWRPVSILFFTFSSLNVLPIVMMITWFLQAYFAPRSTDPQMAAQQKMMMFMPVLFGLMCYNYASGLSLYFFVNSLLAMAEQKIIKKVWLSKLQGQGTGSKP